VLLILVDLEISQEQFIEFRFSWHLPASDILQPIGRL
jgi:hypothetical protein